jgi:oligopeptide transport system permease protein
VASYVIRRVLVLALTVFVALSLLFLLFFALPGDPAHLIAGGARRPPDPGVVERAAARYGLDEPILVQFGRYWQRTLQWDLGDSFINGRSVNEILGDHATNSVRLGVWAILLEVVVGVGVGLLAAIRRHSVSDRVTTIVTAGMSALPVFVLGFLLQYAFAVYPNKHGWPDVFRMRVLGLGPDSWTLFFVPTGEQWRYLLLPAVTLASVSTALVARMMRGSMLEVLHADYIRTARSKGLTERAVVARHGLRNALLPVVTLVGIDVGTVIGAAVLTETVFSWPGLGSEIADAVLERDLPVMLGLTLAVVLLYAVMSLLVDLAYAWLDPRIRLREQAR